MLYKIMLLYFKVGRILKLSHVSKKMFKYVLRQLNVK